MLLGQENVYRHRHRPSIPSYIVNTFQFLSDHRNLPQSWFINHLEVSEMAARTPVMLLLGFGSNVGHSVSDAFAAKGYIVARASRKIKEEESTATEINFSIDLSDPQSVVGVFSKLKDTHGLPSVVVYNGTNNFPMHMASILTHKQLVQVFHQMIQKILFQFLWRILLEI